MKYSFNACQTFIIFNYYNQVLHSAFILSDSFLFFCSFVKGDGCFQINS